MATAPTATRSDPAASPRAGALLSVRDLRTQFDTEEGTVRAVDGVSLDLAREETLGIVGESGSGKSVTVMSVMRLIQSPPGRIESGTVTFEDRKLIDVSHEGGVRVDRSIPESEMRSIRGNQISMIFQDPMTSLNPVMRVGDQVAEVYAVHRGATKREAAEHAVEMLRRVRIPSPEQRATEYPHQFSGGMRQRAMIAMALACNPKLLIADEPTTALDVTIQAQILELMREVRREFHTAIILITHNLGIVAELCDRVAVMYAGRIVEMADTRTIFQKPMHPYTIGLMGSIPRVEGERKRRLDAIEGQPPSLSSVPTGCAFHPRCRKILGQCPERVPTLTEVEPGHFVACYLFHG